MQCMINVIRGSWIVAVCAITIILTSKRSSSSVSGFFGRGLTRRFTRAAASSLQLHRDAAAKTSREILNSLFIVLESLTKSDTVNDS